MTQGIVTWLSIDHTTMLIQRVEQPPDQSSSLETDRRRANRLCTLLLLLRPLSNLIASHMLEFSVQSTKKYANLVFVHNPALKLFVVSIVTAPPLHNVVDGQVLQSCALRERFAVAALTHAGRASHYDVWLVAHVVLNENVGRKEASMKRRSTGFYSARLIACFRRHLTALGGVNHDARDTLWCSIKIT